MARKVHLVGSYPAEITEREPAQAWSWLREQIGDVELTALPFDDDPRWVVHYMRALAERGVLRTTRDGDFSHYDAMPIYRFTRGATRDVSALRDTERVERTQALLTARADLADSATAAGRPVQLSRPNPLDAAFLILVGKPQPSHPLRMLAGSAMVFRYLPAFRRAAERETRDAAETATALDVPVVWQLETPAVLYALNLLPRVLRPLMIRVLARQVAGVLGSIPRESAVLHLCYGNLANTELIAPRDTWPVVNFLNALAEQLEARSRPLPPVHVPFAYGSQPPPTSDAYYAPLAELRHEWPLIAGVADEQQTQTSHDALHVVEKHLGRQAEAVATPCGMGRRSVAEAEKSLRLQAELART